MDCLSRVLYVPAPTPVTASYGCCVPHYGSDWFTQYGPHEALGSLQIDDAAPPPNPPVPAAGHRWMFFADSCITFALFEWVAMMGRGTKMVENHRIEINGKKRWICEERTRGRKELTPENLLRTNFSTVHYFFYVGLSSHGEWRSWGRSATTFCTKAKSKR